MWTLLPLLAAIGISYVIIRRIRLVRERRERAATIKLVEAAFLQTSEKFSVSQARTLLKTIQKGKLLRRKYLQPELQRLERALSKWNQESDAGQEQTAVLNGVAHLYVKWRDNLPALE